jgi:yeast amino acid transporter
MKADDMDLVTGRRELDTPALIEEEKRQMALMPKWRRIYKAFC